SLQDRSPFFIVVYDLADGVQHVAALVVHVAGAFAVGSISADDRLVVANVLSAADHIVSSCLFAPVIFDKQVLGVICKSFMYPHIASIAHRDFVSKPLVS